MSEELKRRVNDKIADVITNELFERFSTPSAAVIGVQLARVIVAIPEIAAALSPPPLQDELSAGKAKADG